MMRRLYHKLLESLNISGRDLAVFLLALLLAFSIWLIHNLALKYNDYLEVTIVANCNIDGHSSLSTDKCNVIARCRATGYKVITLDYLKDRQVVNVKFDSQVMHHLEEDLFYVTSSDLHEYAHLIYGDGVSVEYFVSDTLFFTFPVEVCKKVPVQPVYSLSYMPQYMTEEPIHVTPDSVLIYGEPSMLEIIDRVYTDAITHEQLNEDIQGVTRIKPINGLRIQSEEIHYTIDVTRYVQVRDEFTVSVNNPPVGKSLTLYPSTVSVSMRCVFPFVENPLDNISLYVDYEDFENSISGNCPVKLAGVSKGIISYEIEPSSVECVVSDRR